MNSTASVPVAETPVKFLARDGFELHGVIHAPEQIDSPGVAVVLNCGGGIPSVRYANFARYLAKEGIAVLTYDYRGIGKSRPSSLRGFRATVEDWSEHDCGGAIAFLKTRFRTSALVGVAHSIGAFLMGGAPNVDVLSRLVFVGAHTGYFGDYRPLYRWPMAILWHGIMPVVTHAMGYFPGRRLRLGDDIPRDIALQWSRRRSANPRVERNTRADSARSEAFFRRCALAAGSALVLGFTDDAFATAAGTSRFLAQFPAIEPLRLELAPKDVGLERIGHFGFFRRASESTIWPLALEYIRSGTLTVPPSPGAR